MKRPLAHLPLLGSAVLAFCCPGCSSSKNNNGHVPDAGVHAPDARVAGLSPCIADWPAAGRSPEVRPSLEVGPPRILWTKTVVGAGMWSPGRIWENSGLVLSKGRLVFAVGGPLVLCDRDGNLTRTDPMYQGNDFASPATVDEDGNIYSVALSGVYSFEPTGKMRWSLATNNLTGAEFKDFYPPALSPDGVLYAVCADGYLRAIRISNGQELWRQPAPVRTGPSQVMGGAGGAVFMLNGSSGVWAYDVKSGARLGEVRTAQNQSLFASKGVWALGWSFEVQLGGELSFDKCGRQKWSMWVDNTWEDDSGIVAFGEQLISVKWQADRNANRLTADEMTSYAADGTLVHGPVAGQGAPYLAGADGTVYTVNCAESSPKVNQLIAWSSDLKEIWHLDIGEIDHCPVGSGVLDDDGILYLARSRKTVEGVDIVAIQTQSPGLAESSWPNLRHDNRGTLWLTPLPPPAQPTQPRDGSARSSQDVSVDAPLR